MLEKIREKYNKIPLSVKASVWFVICGVLKDAIDILVTPIFTRILTTEQYGIYNVYNSWFQIFKIIFTLFLFSDVFNVGLVKFEEERDRFISSTLGFITTVTGVFLALYLLQHTFWEQILDLPGFMILLLFAQVLSYVPYHCWIRRERFDYHYKQVVIVSFLYVFFQPALGIFAICCLDMSLDPGYTRIVAAVSIQFLIGMLLYIGMMCRGKKYFHRGYWRYSLRTGIVLVPYNLSKIVLNQSDRIMINRYSGKADTGVYSVAHSAAFVVQVVMDGLNGAFVPWLYKKLKKKEYEGIAPVVNVLILMASGGVFAISLIAPEVMKILARADYYKGVYCVPALSYSVYLIFIYTLLSDIELFYGKNGYVTIASTAGSVINIFLNAVFIPVYGFIAAGYTTLFSYLAMCLVHYIFTRKCLKDANVNIREICSLRFVMAISLALFLFSIICVVLYKWFMVRAALVVLAAFVIVVFRGKCMAIYKEMKGK